MAEEKLETFEDKMNFLAKDEQEAIDGYDKVIALLDAEKDAIVIEQLKKIKIEEEAHKKYLEDVIDNHDLVYTEPLEQEEVKEDVGYDHYGPKDMRKFEGPALIMYDGGPRQIEVITRAKNNRYVWKNKAGTPDSEWHKFNSYEDALKVQKVVGGEVVSWNEYFGIKEGAEGHKVPGKEYVIYEIDDKAKKAPIVAIRKTYTEAQYFCNKDENFTRELGIEEVPVGKFKKGDDFYGPFDSDWNLIEEKKEDHVTEYIEMPHEVYTTKEDIIRVNKELEEKAKAGQLIGIRKESKLLMLAEPAINGIWTIYLTDEGFIEKIVVF